jgi:hypothetical protein
VFTIVLVMLEGVSPQDRTAKQGTSSLARLSSARSNAARCCLTNPLTLLIWILFELELIASRLMLDRKHEREHRSDSA